MPVYVTESRSDGLLRHVIWWATEYRGFLKNQCRNRVSLVEANAVLDFFVENAPRLPDISTRALIAMSESCREHPGDWQDRARDRFRAFPRAMAIPRHWASISPPSRITSVTHHGDSQQVLQTLPTQSVHCIVTSPPYAMRRAGRYPSVPASEYVEWFTPFAEQMLRVLTVDGSLFLNIHPHCEDGVIDPYVDRLVAQMGQLGWRRAQDYFWHKTNPYPGHHPRRLKNGLETIYHFTKSSRHKFFPNALNRPAKPTATRTPMGHPRLRQADTGREKSGTGSGMDRDRRRMVKQMARASNVWSMPSGRNTKHPASFPVQLPESCILLTTHPYDVVLDPFAGAGTTGTAADRHGRSYIGIEIEAGYVATARSRLAAT